MSREECIKYFTHIQDEEQKWILKQLIKIVMILSKFLESYDMAILLKKRDLLKDIITIVTLNGIGIT